MNHTNITAKKLELANLIARKAMVSDNTILNILEEKIKALEGEVASATPLLENEGKMMAEYLLREVKKADATELLRGFEHVDSLIALRALNSAIYSMMKSAFFNNRVYRSKAAAGFALNTTGRRDWGLDDGETSTSPYKDAESAAESMLRLQEETEAITAELPKFVRASLTMQKHCVAEGKKLTEYDQVPDPEVIWARLDADDKKRQEKYKEERAAIKAQTPGILNFLNMGS